MFKSPVKRGALLSVGALAAMTSSLLLASPASAANIGSNPGHYGGHDNVITDTCWTGVHSITHDDPNLPDTALWCQIQFYASLETYTGPIDGAMGSNSWIGFQHNLHRGGFFNSAYTGKMDTETQKAMQRLGQRAAIKYTGPVDGAMGRNSWISLAYELEGNWRD